MVGEGVATQVSQALKEGAYPSQVTENQGNESPGRALASLYVWPTETSGGAGADPRSPGGDLAKLHLSSGGFFC